MYGNNSYHWFDAQTQEITSREQNETQRDNVNTYKSIIKEYLFKNTKIRRF